MHYDLSVSNQQAALVVDEERLRQAVAAVLSGEGVERATISIALVDHVTMRQLNRDFLNHDYPTDVLSFVLERDEESLEGEIILGTEMARDQAPRYGWSAAEELLLYVIHGALHLVGYDDAGDAVTEMRARETHYLRKLNISPPSALSNEGTEEGSL